jgi:tetratricopeptide (TPR) repeat protein
MAVPTGTGVSSKRRKELREPDPFLVRLMAASDWAQARKRMLLQALIAVVVLGGGLAAWGEVKSRKAARAATALGRALVVANAEVRAAGAPAPEADEAPPEEDRPVFQSEKSRALASLNAYRRVMKKYGSSPLAPIARVGIAAALEDLGRTDEAKRAYEGVVRAQGVPTDIRAQATDGLARCLEAKGDLAGALRQLDALRTMEEGSYRDLAQYGRARIFQKQGKAVQARELLRSIQSSLGAEGAPDRPYLRTQVEERLRELDAVSPDSSGAAIPGPRGLEGRGKSR